MEQIFLDNKTYKLLDDWLKENDPSFQKELTACSRVKDDYMQIENDSDFFAKLEDMAGDILFRYGISSYNKEPYVNELGLAMETLVDIICSI